jgi:integrase
MAWQELNSDDRTWAIPATKTKNKKAPTLPLPQACWTIIEQVDRRDNIDHLFGRVGHHVRRNLMRAGFRCRR